jgi:hypothetical protein
MRIAIAAAFALIAASSLHAQPATPAAPDLSNAIPIAGRWTYAPAPGGGEARFVNATGLAQLTLHCTRATRRVRISKPATGAAPFLLVWTSSQQRNVPASFDPQTNLITIDLPAFDALLDAMMFSRGRLGVAVSGSPALVVPPWPEIARVVEDCRV